MATIQEIINLETGLITRGKLNDNFTNLNTDKLESVDLSVTPSATKVTINNTAGTDADINLADVTNAGLLSPAEKTKLDGIATNATQNSTDAFLLDRTNHTGTQDASTIGAGQFDDARIATSNVTQHQGSVDHNSLLNYDINQHRVINDAAASTTSLFSSSEIESRLSALANSAPRKKEVSTSTEGLGNITLSGEQTLNGYTTLVSDVLVVEQTDSTLNGLYITGAGAWTRRDDFNDNTDIASGALIMVNEISSTVNKKCYAL